MTFVLDCKPNGSHLKEYRDCRKVTTGRMDQLKYRYFRLAFMLKYLQLKRTAFQDWFGDLMTERFPDDFIRIRLSRGDGGLDGYRLSTKTVFQVFAPREFTANELIQKLVGDLETAKGTMGTRAIGSDCRQFVSTKSSER